MTTKRPANEPIFIKPMKIQNPTVFLKDGELFCLTVEVPKLPYFVTTTGWTDTHSKKEYQKYVDALEKDLASAKSSAVKVKSDMLFANRPEELWVLEGYEAEVPECCDYNPYCDCKEQPKFAMISPIHKEEESQEEFDLWMLYGSRQLAYSLEGATKKVDDVSRYVFEKLKSEGFTITRRPSY